jgi:hypothetical protein
MVMHPVILRGLGATTRTAPPVILKRTDEDFVSTSLDEARDPVLEALVKTIAADQDQAGTLKLFQPVHRVFHLAMFEVVCDVAGQPRLDPKQIESAGVVIRRVASARGSGPFGEAWLATERAPVGWRALDSAARTRVDPDAARRTLPDQHNDAVNQKLKLLAREDTLSEDVEPAFVAPPDVCADAGRTIVFGLVPTVSALSGEAPTADAQPYDDDEIAAQLPRFLRAGKAASISELAGGTFTYETADDLADLANQTLTAGTPEADAEPTADDGQQLLASKQMYGFLAMLKVLAIQLDAFGKDGKALRKEIAAIKLSFGDDTRTASEFLAEAVDVLVLSPKTGKMITFPDEWPSAGRAAGSIRTEFGKLLQARFAAFAPRSTRFDDPAGRYRLQGFVRVRRDDGCPPELVWSEPSPPYAIAPWYDNSETPPVLVRLPPITPQNVGQIKPNVSFVVPKGLFNLLGKNKPKKFIDSEASDGGDGGIDWVCGFNIPIITLVAFIVLYIFLTLLNIIFFWLPFVKICFPVPRKMPELSP